MTKFLTATNPGGSGGGTVLYDVYVTSANGKGVKLRSAAYKGNNVIGFYEVGTKGGMITKGSVWSYIQIDGKTGYMMSEFLTTTVPGPVIPLQWKKCKSQERSRQAVSDTSLLFTRDSFDNPVCGE